MNWIQDILSPELIYALGWTVIHSLWQGAAIVLLTLLAFYFYPNKSARVRYALSFGSLLLLFFTALATFFVLFDQHESAGTLIIYSEQLSLEGNPAIPELMASFSSVFNQYLPAIVAGWLIGVVLLLGRLLTGLHRVYHIRTSGIIPLSAEWTQRFRFIQQKANLKVRASLGESALIKTPLVIGFLKPIILFPIGTINYLTPKEVEAILAHELAHLFRQDYFFNIIQSVLEIIFYYHPAAWWLGATIRKEREMSCDELAVKLCGSSLEYAKALVRLEELHRPTPRLAMTFSGKKKHFLIRIKHILNQPNYQRNTMEKLFATSIFLLGILFLSFHPADQKDELSALDSPTLQNLMDMAEDLSMASSYAIVTDTVIPGEKENVVRKHIIQKEDDGQEIELLTENGDIKKLIIDGKEIPEGEYGQHQELLEDLNNEKEKRKVKVKKYSNADKDRKESKGKNKSVEVIINSDNEDDGVIIIDGLDDKIVIELQDGEPGKKRILRSYFNVFEGENGFGDFDFDFNFDIDSNLTEDMVFILKNEFEENKDEIIRLKHIIEEEMDNFDFRMENEREEIDREMDRARREIERSEREIARAHREMERAQEGFSRTHSMRSFGFKGNDLQRIVENELIHDGLIDSRKNYKMEIDNKKMKVNGKKQSEGVRARYAKLIEENSSISMDDSKLVWNRKESEK